MNNSSFPAMLGEKKQSGNGYRIFIFVCLLLVWFLCAQTFVSFTVFQVEVSGASMEHTLTTGDILYASRTAKPRRGDIVIIDVSQYRGQYTFHDNYLIKRLIATEGDAVRCEGGVVSVRYAGEDAFTPLVEDYIGSPTGDFKEVEVGEGEIFFLGDNRGNSTDSRVLGCYFAKNISGVVLNWSLENKQEKTRLEIFLRSLT